MLRQVRSCSGRCCYIDCCWLVLVALPQISDARLNAGWTLDGSDTQHYMGEPLPLCRVTACWVGSSRKPSATGGPIRLRSIGSDVPTSTYTDAKRFRSTACLLSGMNQLDTAESHALGQRHCHHQSRHYHDNIPSPVSTVLAAYRALFIPHRLHLSSY